jgi:DNA-binding response OmpR family regulator
MRRLRQKLEVDANNPQHLQTVRGVGYKLVRTDD